MPGVGEQIQQKPELLIVGAVGVGLVFFMLSNRGKQQPAVTTTVSTTPATETISLGTLQDQLTQYRDYDHAWIMQTLQDYYAAHNGQPPSPDPVTPSPGPPPPPPPPVPTDCGPFQYWDPAQGRCVSNIHPIHGAPGTPGLPGIPGILPQRPTYGIGASWRGIDTTA